MKQPSNLFIAHSEGADGSVQPLDEHLANVAERAAEFAKPFVSEKFTEWLGWWHDAGKVAPDVQDYLYGRSKTKQGPDHSSAGMLAASRFMLPLAFNIAGHHGGLPDKGALRNRIMRKEGEPRVTDALAIAEKYLEGKCEPPNKAELPIFLRQSGQEEQKRSLEFWLRILHSCLVDADCLDTEAHFNNERAEIRGEGENILQRAHREAFYKDQEQFAAKARTTLVNQARDEIFTACVKAAEEPPGIFSLTVPTGGGKTRSSLAFALQHAQQYGKRRIIVALPYTSIIDQNAKVYRKIFSGLDGAPTVLEHHSAVRTEDKPGNESEGDLWRRLAAENWNAPLIITTTIQLLESLFANQSTRCRKLHRLADSVIILDEVQTLPPELLTPTLNVLSELVQNYGVTLVLSTATPPALAARNDFPEGFQDVREIIPQPELLYEALHRVAYEVIQEPWPWSRIAEEMSTSQQALVVCNTIRNSLAVLDEVGDDESIFHLSARLCKAHRVRVLEDVERRLEAGLPVYLVSTQVIEAGVDIDFPLVLRALGPLDRIIQAAGRCNREGKADTGRVIVFTPENGGMPPGAYTRGKEVTEILLNRGGDFNFHAPTVALEYFAEFYDVSDRDKNRIQEKRAGLEFEGVGREYRLIEDESMSVVVRYEPEEKKIDTHLNNIQGRGWANREDFRRLQSYMVNLRQRLYQKALRKGQCREVVPGLWIWEGGYDEKRGLIPDAEPFSEEDLVW